MTTKVYENTKYKSFVYEKYKVQSLRKNGAPRLCANLESYDWALLVCGYCLNSWFINMGCYISKSGEN